MLLTKHIDLFIVVDCLAHWWNDSHFCRLWKVHWIFFESAYPLEKNKKHVAAERDKNDYSSIFVLYLGEELLHNLSNFGAKFQR